MTRLTGIALLACVGLGSTFTFAAVEFRRMNASFVSLDDRVARVENATGAAGLETSTGAPATIAVVHEEMIRLREDVARLRTSVAADAGAAANGAPAAGTGHMARPAATEELAKAVTDALAAKEKADKEKQSKLYRKQMDLSAKAWAGQLAQKLELTEQQKSQIAEIFAEYWTKMSSGWTGAAVDEDAELPDYQKLNEEMNEKVKAVMTTEQAAKYDELVKKNQVWGGVVVDGGGDSDDENK
ncbi:MAG: hypothetical protein HYY18_05740 [Planctomycetes bacterium]|nr:hypothetical protein [Planctomycetota bacterium]